MIREGDTKAWRPTSTEQYGSVEKVSAIEYKTELYLQVYLLCFSLQLEALRCKVSD